MIKKTPFFGSNIFKNMVLKYSKDYKILINYDPDVDGVVAGHIIYELLTALKIKSTFSINQNRNHGLLNFVGKGYFIINVDSSIGYDQLKKLVDDGNMVVSIDHHELEYGSFYEDYPNNYKGVLSIEPKENLIYYENADHKTIGIVINNQYSFEDYNYQFLSGTGVVLEVVTSQYPKYLRREHIAWNGLTLLSDIRDIENPIARKILEQTYSMDIYNETKTLKHVVELIGENQYALGSFKFDRSYIDYTFNPILNAMFRFNRGEDVVKLLRGYSIQGLRTIRKEQKDVLNVLEERVKIIEFQTYRILLMEKQSMDMFELSNFIGYFANRYLDSGKSALALALENGNFRRGSFRGVYSDVDYRQILADNGIDARGHKMAFGIKNFVGNNNVWMNVDKTINTKEKESKPGYTLHEVTNLKSFSKEILLLAKENQFLLSNHFNCINYTGAIFSVAKETKGMIEYKVNNILVTAFDKQLSPRNSYIVPTVSNGFTSLILQKFPSND